MAEIYGLIVGFSVLEQRLDVAKPRIESLNPLVTVETIAKDAPADGEEFEALIQRVDLVCVTDEAREILVMFLLLLACCSIENA